MCGIYYFIPSAAEATIVLPYIELGTTEAVETHTLPTEYHGLSEKINVELPIGVSILSPLYVSIEIIILLSLPAYCTLFGTTIPLPFIYKNKKIFINVEGCRDGNG